MTHEDWLTETIAMAIQNVKDGQGPFAAIVVKDDEIIGRGTNLVDHRNDPSAHAELLAIREACQWLGSTDLSDCTLYASGEPCPMCLGAAYWATVGAIHYACSKTDAQQQADFGNPLANFFADQGVIAEQRSVPFIQTKVDNAIAPFLEWKRVNN